MKIILLMILCFWNLSSQAASQAFEFYSQKMDSQFSVPKETNNYLIKESLGFNGWYSMQPKSDKRNKYLAEQYFINGDDSATATKILYIGPKNQVELYTSVNGKLVENKDFESIKSTLKELISSRKKEWETHIGDGGEPVTYIMEGSACSRSQAAEAQLLKKNIHHVVLKVPSGFGGSDHREDLKAAESFYCLSEPDFRAWAVSNNAHVKQTSCGKPDTGLAIGEISKVLSAISKVSGIKKPKLLPIDYTLEMTGNW